jgi:hypothetical protein
MMRRNLRISFLLISMLFTAGVAFSQVLWVREITQERNQWCWAGVSACVLEYYGYPVNQCEIADYTRNVSSWHDFGDRNCCENPSDDCNHWNYLWGYEGSIHDILHRFGPVENHGLEYALTHAEVQQEIDSNRLFIVRWGWATSGGHFTVGYGLWGERIFYMDPWYGEGFKMGMYDWLVCGGNHTWTHTTIIRNVPSWSGIGEESSQGKLKIYPNPVKDQLHLEHKDFNQLTIFDIGGHEMSVPFVEGSDIDVSGLIPGVYLLSVELGDHSIQNLKFVKQ